MDEFERRMEALKARFVERAVGDGLALREARAAGDRVGMRRIAHGLAGNAGLFGQPQLGETASALDDALGTPASDEQLAPLLEAVLALIPEG